MLAILHFLLPCHYPMNCRTIRPWPLVPRALLRGSELFPRSRTTESTTPAPIQPTNPAGHSESRGRRFRVVQMAMELEQEQIRFFALTGFTSSSLIDAALDHTAARRTSAPNCAKTPGSCNGLCSKFDGQSSVRCRLQ
ncbi:hypothetical protein Mapa_001359 [Marchantia paleacea]|nr:hypothetical protein Mapa_001359 [Marchantia paleacea]